MRAFSLLKKQSLFIAISSLFFLAACNNEDTKLPDISNIKVELKSRNLANDLYAIDTNNIATGLAGLSKEYPVFLNFYLDTLMGFAVQQNYTNDNPAITEGVHSFLTYKDYKNLHDTVLKYYPNTKDIEAELTNGFRYLKHYYPNYEIPEVIFFQSGLQNWGVVSYDGILGIGLDMFLGEQFPFYASVGQPSYMNINFRKEAIAPSVFAAIYNDFHPFEDEEKTLLEMMIQKGKQQYFVAQTLPKTSLENRIGYTKEQLEWCATNEAMIYNFFLEQQLMYERNWSKMRRFVVYGPNTSGMPAESPGNIGTWLGLQIVNAYAKENPTATLEDIFKETDAAVFLRKAKYKPRK